MDSAWVQPVGGAINSSGMRSSTGGKFATWPGRLHLHSAQKSSDFRSWRYASTGPNAGDPGAPRRADDSIAATSRRGDRELSLLGLRGLCPQRGALDGCLLGKPARGPRRTADGARHLPACQRLHRPHGGRRDRLCTLSGTGGATASTSATNPLAEFVSLADLNHNG